MTKKELEIKACRIFREPDIDLLRDYMQKFGLEPEVQDKIARLFHLFIHASYNNPRFANMNRKTYISSILYIGGIIANSHITQKEIAKMTGTTETTLSNRHREMIKLLNEKMPDIVEVILKQKGKGKIKMVQKRM